MTHHADERLIEADLSILKESNMARKEKD